MEYQIQVWSDVVKKWQGLAVSDMSPFYDRTSEADAKRAAKIARQQYGWKTRVVIVFTNEESSKE